MRITINAGHTKKGVGTGAKGYLNESAETRKIACELLALFADTDIEAVPAIFDVSDNNLREAVEAAKDSNLFVSIHLNAGGGEGAEVYTWKGQSNAKAAKIVNNLASLGFKNRGIKDGSKLYVIRNTACTALLVEVCFVDSKGDSTLYQNLGYRKIARAIYDAIK